MTATTFLDNFHLIAEAPGGVPKLREMILQLAVRGKLVPQNPKEEPAADLVKKIQSEKQKQLRGTPYLEMLPVKREDILFYIPSSWQWVRLNTVVSYMQRGKSPKYAVGEGRPVVSQKCVQWKGLDLEAAKLITFESIEDYEDIRFLRSGDLLWNSTGTGTIGRIVRIDQVPQNLVCDSHVMVVRCMIVDPEYVRTWLRSNYVYGQIEERAAGSTNQVELTARMAREQVVPLPPLAEQKRIVAKVDELMKRCDELETRQKERNERRTILTASCLHALSSSPEPRTLNPKSKRAIERVLDNFPLLLDTPESVAELRKTILQLAVQGKLVPQDPNDEPTEELIGRIDSSRNALLKAGIVPKQKPLADIGEEECQHSIPETWLWIRLQRAAEIIDPNPSHRMPRYCASGVPFVSTENFIGREEIDFSIGKQVDEAQLEEQKQGFIIRPGSFALSRIGTIGKTRMLPLERNYCMSHALVVIAPYSKDIDSKFLRMVVSSDAVQGQASHGAKSIGVPDLGMGKIRSFVVPLPPFAEQRRIVAKVEQLMDLVDALETQLAASRATAANLLSALVAELTTQKGDDDET